MAINPNIPMAALSTYNSGGGKADDDPFAFISQLSSLKESQQRIRNNEQVLRDKKREQDDLDAIERSVKKFTPADEPGGNPNWNMVLYDLHGSGRANAAIKLHTQILEQGKKKADEYGVTLENNKKIVDLAMKIGQGITDEKSFTRAKGLITRMNPEWGSMLGERYDPKVVEQLVLQGSDQSDLIAAQRLAFDKAKDVLDRTRQTVQDGRDWADKEANLFGKWTEAVSGFVSLARTAEDYTQGLALANEAMETLPDSLKRSVLGQFDVEYSRGAVENARQLGMSQSERSQERNRNATLAEQRAARAAEDMDGRALTPEAKQILAHNFAITGTMPPMGLGGKATQMRTEIYNLAGAMYANLNLAEQQAAYKANQKSLVEMQPKFDALKSFENTAMANLRNFLTIAKGTVDAGAPIINRPLRSVNEKVLGSEQQAAFNVARGVVIPEFARILTQPNLSGVLSDSAREEIDQLMKSNYTYKQLYSVAQVLVQDVENRTKSMEEQMAIIKQRISAPPVATPMPGAIGSPQATTQQGGTRTGLPPNYSGEVTQNGVKYKITTDANGNILTQSVVR